MAESHPALHLHPVSPDDWESHRDVRLAMLQDAPDAFWFTYADEAVYDEADWRERIEGAWLVQARDSDGVLGSAGLGSHWEPERATTATLFGMYVAPRARGRGVGEALVGAVLDEARRLVKDGASLAAERGHSHLVYWVGTDNGRAVAFASGMGFRPTDYRRPMGVVSEEDGEEEIAMVLPLGADNGPLLRL